ncbi:hypothetical protein DEO72_LG1g2150 [Vigna unguiculata]|uniref:Uncharacterized protein n=1 Tax=Vigna unguiculata TaxID=3917 RepID=A0A4D6KPK3_VIGUN|nr:hypothetical protein DEO72_LG1g2150 [Vigna unguiculata]
MVGGIPMETVREVREDPPEELAESNWSAKGAMGGWLPMFRGYCFLGEGERHRPRMPLVGASNRKVLLHVHVPLLSVTCAVAAGRLQHGPRQPTTWLSLISRPSISRLVAFSQSFKHFKDGYFKVVVKEEGKSHFLNADGSKKFLFSLTGTPSQYKDMGTDELSAGDKEVVETLMKFTDKLPTKGLTLRKEMAAKAKKAGTKRKAELPPRPGKGKDVKKVRAALLGSGLDDMWQPSGWSTQLVEDCHMAASQ